MNTTLKKRIDKLMSQKRKGDIVVFVVNQGDDHFTYQDEQIPLADLDGITEKMEQAGYEVLTIIIEAV